MSSQCTRRGVVLGALAALLSRTAEASPRPPRGGRIALRVPFSMRSMQPHELDDWPSMWFGSAQLEGLYEAVDGVWWPRLAEALPRELNGGLLVPLRLGVRTAQGQAVDAAWVLEALGAARRGAAALVWASLPPAKAHSEGVWFATRERERLLSALASPLSALCTPQGAHDVDATGPFSSRGSAGAEGRRSFVPNPRAASGPPLLDALTVRSASSLSDSLRAFESGADQLGWHGLGLHDQRPGARSFRGAAVAAVVLTAGRELAALDRPGAAQRLCDALPPKRLAHLNLGSWSQGVDAPSVPGASHLLVADGSPYLRELAETLALAWSRAGAPISVRSVLPSELRERARTRQHALMLRALRLPSAGELGLYGALLAAADPQRAPSLYARGLPRTGTSRGWGLGLRAGLLGELRWQGGLSAELQLPVDGGLAPAWADAYVARRKA